MFDEMIIREGSVRNVVDADGAVTGFSFATHIPYYRGLGLSMIEVPEVAVDGIAVSEEDLRFTYNGVTRTFAEPSRSCATAAWQPASTRSSSTCACACPTCPSCPRAASRARSPSPPDRLGAADEARTTSPPHPERDNPCPPSS